MVVGFVTILLVIAVGARLAHRGVLDERAVQTMGEIAFFVATPTLMVVTIAGIDLAAAGSNIVASAVALGLALTTYVLVARLRAVISALPTLQTATDPKMSGGAPAGLVQAAE